MYFLIATILFSSKGGDIAVAANSLLLSNILVLAEKSRKYEEGFHLYIYSTADVDGWYLNTDHQTKKSRVILHILWLWIGMHS